MKAALPNFCKRKDEMTEKLPVKIKIPKIINKIPDTLLITGA
jgi:hypothetical protein